VSKILPQKILVIQLRRIGDCLLTTPLVRALRDNFPDSGIDFLVEPASRRVFQGNPFINRILTYDPQNPLSWIRRVRQERYDWVIDGLSNPRSALLTMTSGASLRAGFSVPFWKIAYNVAVERPFLPEYAARTKLRLLESAAAKQGLRLAPHNLSLDFFTSPEEKEFAKDWFRSQGFKDGLPVVALSPTHRRAVRRWTPKGFAALSKLIQKSLQLPVVALWGPSEEDQLQEVLSLAGNAMVPFPKTTLGQMAAIIERCSLMIANDNGPKHIAVAVGTPTLTLYGPTHPSNWNPPETEPHRFIQVQGLGCLGCNLNHCPYRHECMEWLDPETVFQTVQAIMTKMRP